jgi:putative methyltransferase (TIGR04325 family)
MSSRIRHIVKQFSPPILTTLVRNATAPLRAGRRRAAIAFQGDYVSWPAAAAHAGGYDATDILGRVVAATRRVVADPSLYERDSVVFDQVQYSWPLLAALLQVALETGRLRVVDFGGALGSTWRQNGRFLRRLKLPMTWTVVEQPRFVIAGNAEFTDDVLHFSDTMAAAGATGVDVVLLASSLCYVPDPEAVIMEAAAIGARYLILDRMPTTDSGRDRIAVQNVSEPIYPASYPVWIFDQSRLLSHWLAGWRLIERWESELQPEPLIRHRGFFLERIDDRQ